MPTPLENFRKSYPMYKDKSDQEVGDFLYSKYYSNQDKGQFFDKFYGRGSAQKALTDIPGEIVKEYGGAVEDIKEFGRFARGQTPIKGAPGEDQEHEPQPSKSAWDTFKEGLVKGGKAVGGAIYAGSPFPPVVGAAKSIYGHAAEGMTGRPYEKAKGDLDAILFGAGVGGAVRGAGRLLRGKPRTPPKPDLTDEFGITTPRGPISSKMSEGAQQHVGDFEQQLHEQRRGATEMVGEQLDPMTSLTGQPSNLPVGTAREGGGAIYRGFDRAERAAKATENKQYAHARALGGELRAIGFQGIGDRIKQDLSRPGGEQHYIDEVVTPASTRMIMYLDKRVEDLNIQNFSTPQGPGGKIVGISLDGVDQIRKVLLGMAGGAANKTDRRAARAILKSFDSQVTGMTKSPGLYRGNPSAVKAWELSRDLHYEHEKTFGAGSKSGKIIDKIIHGGNTPNDVADFAYGGVRLNPTSTNVKVMTELKRLVGENSDEWIQAKKGLWRRITQEGQVNKPEATAKRIRDFMNLDGKEMADIVFNPQEKRIIMRLADVHDKMGIEKIAQNESFTKEFLHKVGNVLNLTVAGTIGHGGVHGLARAAQVAGGLRAAKAYTSSKEQRELEKSLPIVSREIEKWKAAMTKAQRSNARVDRANAYTATYALSQVLRQKFGINMGPMQPPDSGDKLDLKRRYGGPQQ